MTDKQRYLTIGIPTMAAMIGIRVNVGYFVAVNGRIGSIENKFDTKFDILTGKVIEMGNRLVRLEERLSTN